MRGSSPSGSGCNAGASADEQAHHLQHKVCMYLLSVSGTGHTVRGSPVSKGGSHLRWYTRWISQGGPRTPEDFHKICETELTKVWARLGGMGACIKPRSVQSPFSQKKYPT